MTKPRTVVATEPEFFEFILRWRDRVIFRFRWEHRG